MIKLNNYRKHKGYAMGLFLMVFILVGSFTLNAFLSSTRGLAEAERGATNAETRALGQDVLSRFYSEFVTNTDFRTNVLQSKYNNTKQRSLNEINQLDITNQCDATTDTCFTVNPELSFYNEALRSEAAAGNKAAVPQAIAVRVDVFGECATAEASSNCMIKGSFVQRVTPSQFYDYSFYTQYVSLDPALYSTQSSAAECIDRYALRSNPDSSSANKGARNANCLEIAYQSDRVVKDEIDGPVFTNDDYVAVCGSPLFNAPVYSNPTNIKPSTTAPRDGFWKRSTAVGCPAPVVANTFVGNKASLTSSVERQPTQEMLLPSDADYQKVLNAIPGVTKVTTTATNKTITFDNTNTANKNSTLKLGATSLPVSAIGVYYFTGDIEITGRYKGSLSIYSTGNITINGNLVKNNTSSVLGLIAKKRIQVEQIASVPKYDDPANAVSSTPVAASRTIDAILMSLDNSIAVVNNATDKAYFNALPAPLPSAFKTSLGLDANFEPSWKLPKWQEGVAPTLIFNGAMASKYQGVFGGYNSANGTLNTGFKKDFTFDERLKEGQVSAPLLPTPISGNWTRVDFSEVPGNF